MERANSFTFLGMPLIQGILYSRYFTSTYQAPCATSRREPCNQKKRSSDTVSCPHQGLAPISLRTMPYFLGSAFFHGCQGGKNNKGILLNILNIQGFPLRRGLSMIKDKSSPMPCRLGHALFLTSFPWRPCQDPLPESLTTSRHYRLNLGVLIP